jgi:hypothetical protein
MMEKSDCNLNQSLQKLLLALRRSPPDVFKRFMRVKKLCTVEQFKPVSQVVGKHK